MDVSNSTGSGTDYRVVAGGGAAPVPPEMQQAPPDAQPVPKKRGKKQDPEVVEIEGMSYKVLRRGTLEPNTYVTIKLPGNPPPPCLVQFLRDGEVISTFSVPPKAWATARGEKAAHSGEFLVVLTENGKGPHETRCCRRKSGR